MVELVSETVLLFSSFGVVPVFLPFPESETDKYHYRHDGFFGEALN